VIAVELRGHRPIARVFVEDVLARVRLDVDMQAVEAVGRLRPGSAAMGRRSWPLGRTHVAILEPRRRKGKSPRHSAVAVARPSHPGQAAGKTVKMRRTVPVRPPARVKELQHVGFQEVV